MAKPKQHQEKADGNRQFLDSIRKNGPPDWITVVAFYTAVHLAEKLRAYDGEHSTDHEDRNKAIRREHPEIHTAYHELFNAALTARYFTVQKFKLTREQVNKQLVDNYLVHIEKYVNNISRRKTSAKPSKK